MFCLGAAIFGAMILLPLYFQVARGQDAIQTGLMLIPQGVGAAIGMNRSALATRRYGAGLTSLVGVMIMIAATVAVPVRRQCHALWSPRVRDGGAGHRSRSGHDAGHDCGVLLTAPRPGQRREPPAERDPAGGRHARDGHHRSRAAEQARSRARCETGAYTNPAAVAAAFADTYRWVILINALALIPAAALWRIERQGRLSGEESQISDESLIEAVL